MSIAEFILDLNCESIGCEENPCPYKTNKRKCPKQQDCLAMCDLWCSNIEQEDDNDRAEEFNKSI